MKPAEVGEDRNALRERTLSIEFACWKSPQ
jgi:hypothetical protein